MGKWFGLLSSTVLFGWGIYYMITREMSGRAAENFDEKTAFALGFLTAVGGVVGFVQSLRMKKDQKQSGK